MEKIKFLFYLCDTKDIRKIFLIFLFLIFSTIFEILSIGILIPLTYSIFEIQSQVTSSKVDFLTQKILIFDNLNSNLIVLIFIFGIKNYLIYIFNKFRIDFSAALYLKNSKRVFENYLNLEYVKHLSRSSYKTNQNIINELRTLIERLLNPSIVLISEFSVLFVIILFLIGIDQEIVIITLFFLGIVGLLYFKIYKKFFKNIGEDRRLNESKSRQSVIEGLVGLKDIQILKKQNFFVRRFIKHAKIFVSSNNYFAYAQLIPRLVLETIVVVTFVFLIILMSVYFKTFTTETLIVFLVVSYRILPSVNRIVTSLNNVLYSLPIYDHLRKEKVLQFSKNLKSSSKKTNFKFKKYIQIKNMDFRYRKSKKKLFSNLNLKIAKNDLIGIFGKSGSGKSTLINIIIGLIKPDSGLIKIDDKNLIEVKEKFQSKISYIGQDPFIIDDNVLVNICFKNPISNFDKIKIIKCLKKVSLYEDILKLKNGLEENLGTGGSKLSGGQKQKLLIARTLYFNKEILILDEATNSLDKNSEEEIFKLILKIKKSRTIFVITHDQKLQKRVNKKFILN